MPISLLCIAALVTSPKPGRLQKIFNRVSRAIIVASGTRITLNGCSNFLQSHIRLLKIAPAIEKCMETNGKNRFASQGVSIAQMMYVSKLILKTIGNRKGDCAWSCSRWQTQPEKICKSQRTNQYHSLRTFYWFVLCNLQIFSGCVCHLEQLHAQSPFLFPIVFSINLIPFFDISSVLAVHSPGLFGYVLLYFTWATARSQELLFVVWLVMHFEHSTAAAGSERLSTRMHMHRVNALSR